MSNVMKINSRGQIRIPKNILKTLKIEPGDYIELDLEADYLVLKPRKLIDPTQDWYWTKEWQETEAEVDKQVEKNQVSPVFYTSKEGLKWLDK